MKKTRKRILLFLVIVLLLIICTITLYYVSKSRIIQFFGEIITSIPNGDKKIALTFDDGPTENTSAILDKLDEMEVKATFFVCGAEINARPQDAKAIVEAGHELGNHSYSHKRMILKPYAFCKEEVERTNELIWASGYVGEIFFRPPYGKKLFVLPYCLNQIGMTTIMWSIEPKTVLGADASPEDIAQYVIDNVEGGSIILLHAMYNTENVLAALDILIPELQRQGYTFCTIFDLYDEYR